MHLPHLAPPESVDTFFFVPDAFDSRDVSRVLCDDAYVTRWLVHARDCAQPGTVSDPAARAVSLLQDALRWRAKFDIRGTAWIPRGIIKITRNYIALHRKS